MPHSRTLLEGFVVRVIRGNESAHGNKYICTVALEVHVKDITAFSSVEDEYFHLFQERSIDIPGFSSQKWTDSLGSQSGTVAAGRSFRTGSLAFYENRKKCLATYIPLLSHGDTSSHNQPRTVQLGRTFSQNFEKKDQRHEHEGFPRCPRLGTCPEKWHPSLTSTQLTCTVKD